MSIVTIKNKAYTVDSLYQWDKGQVLEIRGLSLATTPEIHFYNGSLDSAIVRESTMDNAGIITVNIPDILLQKPHKIKVYVCMTKGDEFRSLYEIEIPVKARSKPEYYVEDDKTEIYSVSALVAEIENTLEKCKDLSEQYEEVKNAQQLAESSAVSASKSAARAETIKSEVENEAENVSKLVKSVAIKETASGETIVATDSADAEFEGLRIFGRSEQGSTTGAQLLDVSALKTNDNATTIIIADDGYEISVSGGDANNYSYSLTIIDLSAILGKTIYIKADTISGVLDESVSKKCVQITVESSDGKKQYIQLRDNVLSANVLIQEDVLSVKIGIYCNNSGSVLSEKETITVKGLIVSLVESKWEPYTGGIASPNPNYPQEIESAGDGGSVGVGVLGKNLLEITAKTQTMNGVTFTVNDDGSITVNGTATAACYYVVRASAENIYKGCKLSGCPNGGSSTTYSLIAQGLDENYKYQSTSQDNGNGVEIPNTPNVRIEILVRNGVTVSNATFHPMIRLTSITDDTYEPYQKQSAIFTTPNGLPGIKVTDASLATDTDESGQMWCADEVDLERGVYVQRINKISSRDIDVANEYYELGECARVPLNIKAFGTAVQQPNGLSTHFAYIPNYVLDQQHFYIQNNTIWTYVLVAKLTERTIDGVLAYMKSIGAEFAYILATPIETPLSTEEIAAYKALHTNHPTTTVMNDCGADMEVEYVADTKAYIDKKFAELAAAMV